MKKILFILLFAPFMLNAQTPAPLVDLSKYHDDNRIKEMIDNNFTNITQGGYELPYLLADSIHTRELVADSINALKSDIAVSEITFLTSDTINVRAVAADSIDVTQINIDSATIVHLNYAPPHASMAFADSAEIIACTEDLWSKVTGNAGALFVTIDQDDITVARDSITIEVDGDYMLVWNMSFRGTASDIWYARIRKNNVASAFQMQRRTANADTGNMGLNAYFDNMAVGDDLSFYIMNTADNDDMTLQASQVIIWMLHPR